jgi:hypothetical protein
MVTRIFVSPVSGWFVGIGVPPSVEGGLGDTAGADVGVGGTAVDATVGGGLAGTATVTVGTGGTAAGDDAGVGVDAQAATKTTSKISTIIL